MTTDITAVEADGQFYVNVSLDGHDKQYGPYSTCRRERIVSHTESDPRPEARRL